MTVDRMGSLLKIPGDPKFFLHENILSVQTFLHKALGYFSYYKCASCSFFWVKRIQELLA